MILRLCVVIPTFNNQTTISGVVKDVVTKTQFPVLVVDDGSETPVGNYLYSWEVRQALEEGRVRVVRFEKNRGKGAALQYAIKDLVAHGFTHMLTMDGDGQHLASEIAKLVDLARRHPWDLIIGNRRLKSTSVPGISKFGRRFSNFWVNYQTGTSVHDSQSGFRLYPLFALQTMKFFTSKYDFEIEVLIRLMWRGITVRECEIEVLYQEGAARVSHFHKFWDNARISVLNTILVMFSLLRSHRSPVELAVSVGLGVFVGCSPFFGFHTFIVAGLAFVLRLNVVAMWLGTHISIPPLAPLLVFASLTIAHQWLGLEETGAIEHFYQWLAGSVVLGAILGASAAVLTYLACVIHRRTSKGKTNWSGKSRGGAFGTWFLTTVLHRLGLKSGYFCLYFIIPYFWLFAPKARRGLNEYYSLLEPDLSWGARQRRVMRHFFRFGQVLMDRVYQGYRGGVQFPTRPEGMEQILNGMRSGRGLIVLSAHLGGWDLAAALLGTHGFSDQIHVVEYKAEGLSFQKVRDKVSPQHVRLVDSGRSNDAIFEIHQALKEGRCLGLMGDRPIGDRFELIPFLGRLAPFDVTAFRLAAALRVPLLFTFGFKGSEGHYDFFARPPREYVFDPSVPRESQLYDWARAYVREVESFVRRYPDQWFNFYPFWSALPVAPNGELAEQSSNYLREELHTRPTAPLEPGPAPTPNGV